MRFILGTLVVGLALLGGRVSGQEAKLDRAKALAELKEIEAKNEKLTQDLLVKAAKELSEAGGDKFKAVQLYLDSYRNVEFGHAQDGEGRYQQWRIENKEKIASLEFGEAVQLHVQYVGLVCRQALGEREAPRAEEWGMYWERLMDTKDKVESVVDVAKTPAKVEKKAGGGKRQAKPSGDDFAYPALESPLVRDRQIQGFLGEVKEATVSSSSVGAIFNQVVRPRLRKAKSQELIRLWDLRIAAMDEGMGKEVKTLGLDDYKVLKRPELMWERADDLEKMGDQEAAWAKKMEILKSCPYHPKIAEWIGEMKQALGEGSPALPEKAP